MLRVGLTGGIASGKSRVARALAAAGFRTLDLDAVAHGVMAPGGAAYSDVVAAFGAAILAADGSIDRKKLGPIVFADAAARERLNAIVHPRVHAEEARVAAALPTEAVLVVEAALLVETGVHLRFDRLLVAHCDVNEQRRRLRERDGLDAAAADARLRAQMPVEDKRRFAHVVIDTGGAPSGTDARSAAVAEELRPLAGRKFDLAAAPAAMRAAARGPAGLLVEAELATGPDLARLARRLFPGAGRPWYAPSAAAGVSDAEVAGLAVPFSLRRRGADRDYARGAAYSLGRLTRPDETGALAVVDAALRLFDAAALGRP